MGGGPQYAYSTRSDLVRQVKKVVHRVSGPSVPKLPVTRSQLKVLAMSTGGTEKGIRDTFMMILMFVGLLRKSEVVGLKFGDVWVGSLEGVEEEVLFVHIRRSKRDCRGIRG